MNFNIAIPPETTGGWISLGILAFAALTLLSGFFFGLRRGFTKSVIRLCTVALAAVISYKAAISITGALDGVFANKSLEEVILSVWSDYKNAVAPKTQEIIAAFDAQTAQLILSLIVGLVIAPIAFLVAFYIVKAVLFIVYWILGAIMKKTSRHKGFFSTVFGGLVGILQGALITLCVLIPVSGFLVLARDVKADILAKDDIPVESRNEIEVFYTAWLDEAIENPLVEIVYGLGGDVVFERLTNAYVGGSSYDTREKAALIATVCYDATDLRGMNWQAPTSEQKAAIERIIDSMGNDEYTAKILAGVLRGSSTALTDNIGVFGLEAPYDSLFTETFAIFSDSDETNVGADLDTMLHVYFTMADSEVLVLIGQNDQEALKAKLTEKTDGVLFIDSIINTLQSNPRTAPLVTMFTKLSVSLMCDSLGLDEDAQVVYESVKDDFYDVLSLSKDDYGTEDEYRDAVHTGISDALESNGIVLEEDIVSSMSDYVAENFSDNEEITDEDINDAILSYYSSYLEYIEANGGSLPEDLPDLG